MNIIVPTARVGEKMRMIHPTSIGKMDIFQCLPRYEAPKAPNRAGSTWSKAALKTESGAVSFGRNGAKQRTPTAITTVVVIAETPIAIVEMTSPSSEFALTLAFCIALSPQGSLRFVMLPVIKLSYVPPAPSIGVYVITSIIELVQ